MNRLICISAMLGCASWASAQAPEAVSEKDFLGEMPMVLSVSRLPQRLDETPGAVTILDRDMIRLSGARDVADLLRLVPGFQTSTSFETVAPLASYHGGFDAYSVRMQVLVDGRSVYSPIFFGSVSAGLQSVSLTDIERIEVLRGSNSAAYGARAMLGVVNIVTRHTADTLGGHASLTGGENGVNDVQARLGWGDENASFRLTMDRRSDAGLAGANGHNEINRVNFRADLRPDASNEIQLRAGDLSIDSGRGVLGKDTNAPRDSAVALRYLQLDWRRNLSNEDDLALRVSHTEESTRDKFSYAPIPVLTIDFGGNSSNDTVSAQHTFRYGSSLRVVWGGELQRETVTSKPLYNTDAALVTEFTRLFGNAEWRIARDWILNAGAMAEHSSTHGDSLAPRLMLNWHLTPGQTLRAGISKAFRPPSAFEKFSDVRYVLNGRPLQITSFSRGQVQPEDVLAREIGYLGDFPSLGLNLDLRIFNEQIRGFVRSQSTASPEATLRPSKPYDYVNSENMGIHGVEYQLKWRPWQDAQFIFSQSYIDINSKNSGSAVAAPKLASSLTYFQKLPGGLDLSLMHQDSGTAALQGSDEDSRVAMTRTDLRLGLPLRFGRNRGEVALVVQNLGMPYADFSPNFQFERRAFVTLRVEN